MEHKRAMERRAFLKGTLGAASLVALAGCDNLTQSSWFPGILNKAEKLTDLVQRAVTPVGALAREYTEADISRVFPANGNTDPGTKDYAEMTRNNFADWDLLIDGLVTTPMMFSVTAVKDMPARTQITRHDCVEGWSAIGKWTGVPLWISYAKFSRSRAPNTPSSTARMSMTRASPITRAWHYKIAITRRRSWLMN